MVFRYVFVLLGWITFNAFSAPLTEEKIRHAREIILYTGKFDPWTKADQAKVLEITKNSPGSVVVVLPVDGFTGDTPLPVSNRLSLIETSVGSLSEVTVPVGNFSQLGLSQLKKEIFNINPALTFSKVKSVVPDPGIRSYLSQHAENYFKNSSLAPSTIDQKVYDQIIADGLYMGRYPSKVPLAAKKVTNSNFVQRFNSDRIRKLVSWMMSHPNLKEFQLEGRTVNVEKYLASGLNGDAYVVNIDGEKFVLKVSKASARARHNMLQAVSVQKWLNTHTQILTPHVLEADADGKYAVIDLVDGVSLDKYISSQGGVIPPDLEKKLKLFYAEALALHDRSAMNLDISGDNIFVKSNGDVVLVDFGPTRPEREFADTYEEARSRWMRSSTMIKKPEVSACYATTLEKLMTEVAIVP